MRKWIVVFYAFFAAIPGFSTEDISGFWKTMDEEGKPQSIIAVYEYEDIYYGRIIAAFDDKGGIGDSIYAPKERAPGVLGDPFYCGLDIIWNLYDAGVKFKGKILDPQKGNIYNSELWIEDGNLIVRGKFLMFGRNMTWFPVSASDLPKNFKLPKLDSFIPSIPEVK